MLFCCSTISFGSDSVFPVSDNCWWHCCSLLLVMADLDIRYWALLLMLLMLFVLTLLHSIDPVFRDDPFTLMTDATDSDNFYRRANESVSVQFICSWWSVIGVDHSFDDIDIWCYWLLVTEGYWWPRIRYHWYSVIIRFNRYSGILLIWPMAAGTVDDIPIPVIGIQWQHSHCCRYCVDIDDLMLLIFIDCHCRYSVLIFIVQIHSLLFIVIDCRLFLHCCSIRDSDIDCCPIYSDVIGSDRWWREAEILLIVSILLTGICCQVFIHSRQFVVVVIDGIQADTFIWYRPHEACCCWWYSLLHSLTPSTFTLIIPTFIHDFIHLPIHWRENLHSFDIIADYGGFLFNSFIYSVIDMVLLAKYQ